jgi:hypothetical protein
MQCLGFNEQCKIGLQAFSALLLLRSYSMEYQGKT